MFYLCSSLTYIPDISKWKFNNKIRIKNIFQGCNSLLIIPDISKWNLDFSEFPKSNPSSSNISMRIVNSDSLLSEEYINLNISENPNVINQNDINLIENNNDFGNSQKNDLENYYDNFYK